MHSIDNAKAHILSLIVPAPDNMKNRIQDAQTARLNKIEKIGALLGSFPELFGNKKLMEQIFDYTKNDNSNFVVRNIKRELGAKHLITFENGIAKIPETSLLTDSEISSCLRDVPNNFGRFYFKTKQIIISEEAINTFTENQIWDFIIKNNVSTLSIKKSNGAIINYDKKILEEFIYNIRPAIKDLTRQFTLQFENGEKILETHAKLLLCGDWFVTILNDRWQIKETIDMQGVSLNGFCGILHRIETGQPHPGVSEDDYNSAEDFLQFTKFPEYVLYEKKDWEQRWGSIGLIQSSPIGLLEDLHDPCPFFENKKMLATHWIFYMPAGVNGKKLKLQTLFDIWDFEKLQFSITLKNGILGQFGNNEFGDYWFAIPKLRVKCIEDGNAEEYKDYLAKKDYDFPLITELVIYHSRNMLYDSGYGFFGNVICKEVNGERQVGANLSKEKITLDYLNTKMACIPVRRFFRNK